MKCFIKTPEGILCKDGKLRSFVNFGTFNWCCKFYKSKGWAVRAADRLNATEYTITFLYKGDEIDANGNVTRKSRI